MRKKRFALIVALLAVMVFAFSVTPVFGRGGPPDEPPGSSGDHAVVPLGKAFDTDGRLVEGYAIIHYKRGFGKPADKPGKGPSGGGEKCYAFLAKDARWKTPEPYLVDPTNGRGLDQATVRDLTTLAVNAWDVEVAFDIFGSEVGGIVDGADTVSPDGKNEVYFADVAYDGAIAVTIVWGVFSGPPFGRELIEWDQVYDDVDFDWSTSGEAYKMDFQNIATHEVGHSAGMGHPDDSCTEETMYRFADYGETKKQDLNTGDIVGINELYK